MKTKNRKRQDGRKEDGRNGRHKKGRIDEKNAKKTEGNKCFCLRFLEGISKSKSQKRKKE